MGDCGKILEGIAGTYRPLARGVCGTKKRCASDPMAGDGVSSRSKRFVDLEPPRVRSFRGGFAISFDLASIPLGQPGNRLRGLESFKPSGVQNALGHSEELRFLNKL